MRDYALAYRGWLKPPTNHLFNLKGFFFVVHCMWHCWRSYELHAPEAGRADGPGRECGDLQSPTTRPAISLSVSSYQSQIDDEF